IRSPQFLRAFGLANDVSVITAFGAVPTFTPWRAISAATLQPEMSCTFSTQRSALESRSARIWDDTSVSSQSHFCVAIISRPSSVTAFCVCRYEETAWAKSDSYATATVLALCFCLSHRRVSTNIGFSLGVLRKDQSEIFASPSAMEVSDQTGNRYPVSLWSSIFFCKMPKVGSATEEHTGPIRTR